MPQPQKTNDRLEDYVPVAERLEKFYERFSDGRILTTIVEHDQEKGFILMRAEVYRSPDDALPAATGHAFEVRGESYVNKTSYVENCETGAVGRALALLGFEVKRSGNGHAPAQPRQQPARSQQQSAPSNRPAQIASVAKIDDRVRARVLPTADEYGDDPDRAEYMKQDETILALWIALNRNPDTLPAAIKTQFKVGDGLFGLTGNYKAQFIQELEKAVEAQRAAKSGK
jgi:hypothetical protein